MMRSDILNQIIINWKYRGFNTNKYSYRFFADLSTGFSFSFEDKSSNKEFLTIEPENCLLLRLLRNEEQTFSSYKLEQFLEKIAYDIVAFGKAYVLIEPKYLTKSNKNAKKNDVFSSLKIHEVKGFIRRRINGNIDFFYKECNHIDKLSNISNMQIIEFDLKDIGIKRNCFKKINEKLNKFDITEPSTTLVIKKADGYDYNIHSMKNRLRELKILKNTGLFFDTSDLSGSYIMFKEIRKRKFRMRLFKYILNKLNSGLSLFVGNDNGSIVAKTIEIDYDSLWKEYVVGKMTESELSEIIFHNKSK